MTHSGCAQSQHAAAFALGALEEHEARAFRDHVAEGCEDCVAACREAEVTVAAMDVAWIEKRGVEPAHAREAEMRERLLSRIDEEPTAAEPRRAWQHWTEETGELEIVRAGEDGFQPTDFEGIEVRPLSVDGEREVVTMLVRMAAGASYPRHRHAGREECYVLSGDLAVGDEEMGAGDYQVAPCGSVHEVQSTREGCTLLIVSSQGDELLD